MAPENSGPFDPGSLLFALSRVGGGQISAEEEQADVAALIDVMNRRTQRTILRLAKSMAIKDRAELLRRKGKIP